MRQRMDEDFATFVVARQARMLRAAFLICGDSRDAEDLVQGALVKLARRWPSLRDQAPEAYLRTVMYHDFVSGWRRRRREVLLAETRDSAGMDESIDGAEYRITIVSALQQLTPKQRAVVVLRWFEDRSERETAELLGVSIGTVKHQNHDALTRLRTLLPDLHVAEGSEA